VKGDGVSEVIGAIILISVAVLAVGILVIVLFTGPLPTSVPAFSGIISSSGKTVYISHEGGDTLYTGQYKILVDGVDKTYDFTKSLTGPFSVGKVMNATLPTLPSRVVMVFNTSWGGGTVLLSADLNFWYSSAWLDRKKITIDHTKVQGSLVDFPVLIYIGSDLNLQKHVKKTDGSDILFTSYDGTTKLPHEIETYVSNDGTLWAWVKVPNVTSAGDTVIYIYYNNSAASNQQDKAGVWSNGYRGVWHLNNSFTDSSPSHYDGTNQGSTDTGTKIAYGRAFDGTSQWIATPSTDLKTATSFTISTWFKADSTTFAHHLIWEGDGVGNGWGETTFQQEMHLSIGEFVNPNSNPNFLSFFLGDIDCGRDTGSICINKSFNDAVNSHLVTAVVQGLDSFPSATLYLDGSPAGTDTGTVERTGRANWNTPLQFGKPGTSERYFDGNLDEIHIATTARSADWIKTEYTNQNNPGVFILPVGSEQTQATMS
jgi:hypothetical protein